jgi:alginate O-acetyltransferase complex protein AlgI
MIPGSYDFLLFVIFAVFLLYFFAFKSTRKYLLLIINLVYIATFGLNHLFSIVGLGLITYILAKAQNLNRKFFLFLGIAINIVALALLQIEFQSSEVTNIIMYLVPIGLSFMVFRNISFLIDWTIHKPSIWEYLNYITFFPTITSGPIVKIRDFNQVEEKVSNQDFHSSVVRIVIGLFKKLVIATYLSNNLVLQTFQISDGVNPLVILLALYGFAIQIYADFSGYSDIAIGVARLLGYKVNENFDAPYLATSIREFWTKWHITLSEWFKEYIYFPLGGNRLGKFREIINTMIVMLLSAMWHGVSINFLIWGLIHGFGMISDKLIKFNFLPIFWRRFITFHLICLSWVFFNIDSFEYAMQFLGNLLNYQNLFLLDLKIDINAVLLILIGFWVHNNSQVIIENISNRTFRLRSIFKGLLLGLALLAIFWFGPDTIPNFIYYNF